MKESGKREGYLVYKGPRGGGWSWNKNDGLVRQRDIPTPDAKEDGIKKYCRRDYNLILYFLDKNSLGSWCKLSKLVPRRDH